jgi:RHS repeat-associated protein
VQVRVADAPGQIPAIFYPLTDHTGTGSVQAIVGDDGNLVERVLYADAYGDAPRYLQGPVVDKITLGATKTGTGELERVRVRVHLSEKIIASSLNSGARLASVRTDLTVAQLASPSPSLEDETTILWSLTANEWDALANANGAVSLEIAATDTLRANGWGATPISPIPEWAQQIFTATDSTSQMPVIRREQLSLLTTFVDGIVNGETKSYETLYEMKSLYLAASDESKAKLLTGFKAAPFVEPATGLINLRNRWYDPSTGTFLSPDPIGYDGGSSNLYAFCGGDPVNCSDPTGNAGVRKGSVSYPDNPLAGETREHYVARLTNSGEVSFSNAAMMGECYYTSQCGSAQITELAQRVDVRVKAQAKMMLTMEAVGIATVFTGGAAGSLVTTYGGGALLATTVGGAAGGTAGQGAADIISGKRSSGADYAQSALFGIGGAYVGSAIVRGVDPGPLTIFRAPTLPIGSPAPLVNGRAVEAQQMAQLQLAKNNDVWRPTDADIDSAAFKVIVGDAKYTAGGLRKGTIFDSTTGGYTEIKAGSSPLVSSYQLRLQVFRSLQTSTPYTIRTSRPVNPEFEDWLTRWGAAVAPLK